MAALTTAEKLVEAERVRHEILTGQGVVRFIDQNGESVQYQMANISRLEAYIQELKDLLNPEAAALRYKGPLKFVFGRRPYC